MVCVQISRVNVKSHHDSEFLHDLKNKSPNLLLSSVIRNILWIMWLILSCSHNSCWERKERLISATE